jgi:hypothetical protein
MSDLEAGVEWVWIALGPGRPSSSFNWPQIAIHAIELLTLLLTCIDVRAAL